MINKKVFGVMLVIAMLMSGVHAQSKDKIRIFNEGAEITVNITGTPGEDLSVLMLDPDTALPDMTTDNRQFSESIAHVDSLRLDEYGKHTFKFKADKTGVYNIYVRGGEIDYTSTNNDAPLQNPDRFYAEMSIPIEGFSHPDMNERFELSKSMIDTFGVEAVAKQAKIFLDNLPEGRKSIFIMRDFSPKTLSGKEFWWDDGVEIATEYLESFFKEFCNIEGQVDFISSDIEHTFSMYLLTRYAGSSDAELKAKYFEILSEISEHPNYTILETNLLARGYDKSADGDIPLSSVGYYNKTNYNYLKFNAACSDIAADYLTRAFYEPARKYFTNIKFQEYGISDERLWAGRYEAVGQHPNYIGGNVHKSGTHSGEPLYSKRTRDFAYRQIFGNLGEDGCFDYKAELYSGVGADFKELMGTIAFLRVSVNSTKGGEVIPYVATESVDTADLEDNRYRAEMLMHIMLHNPDRMVYYNPGFDENFTQKEQAEMFGAVLDEVNDLAAYADRRSLNSDQADYSIPYALSGIYANGRNLWRITPDTTIVSSDEFLVSAEGEEPRFRAGGVEIIFPKGRIIQVKNTESDIGYWVETPEGITPDMGFDESLKKLSEMATISYYNKFGQMADFDKDETFDAVASYQGMYDDRMKFIAAKYDDEGRLIDAEVKDCGVFSPNGNAFFLDMSKDNGVDKIKFLLWKNDGFVPVTNSEI